MKKLLTILVTALLFASCTDAQRSKLGGFGSKFRVELLDMNGKTCREWSSTGKVLSEESSDGYYFTDSKTGNLIEVTGTLVITRLN